MRLWEKNSARSKGSNSFRVRTMSRRRCAKPTARCSPINIPKGIQESATMEDRTTPTLLRTLQLNAPRSSSTASMRTCSRCQERQRTLPCTLHSWNRVIRSWAWTSLMGDTSHTDIRPPLSIRCSISCAIR